MNLRGREAAGEDVGGGIANAGIAFVRTRGRLAGFADVDITHRNAINSWMSNGSRRWSFAGGGVAGIGVAKRFAHL